MYIGGKRSLSPGSSLYLLHSFFFSLPTVKSISLLNTLCVLMQCLTTNIETQSQVIKDWAHCVMSQMFKIPPLGGLRYLFPGTRKTTGLVTVLLLPRDTVTNFWRNYKITSLVAFLLFNHVASEIIILMQRVIVMFLWLTVFIGIFIFILCL